jgi:hypothetical protein
MTVKHRLERRSSLSASSVIFLCVAIQQTTLQEALVQMWREALGNDELTLEDDVLMLGATSLQIMNVIGRLAEDLSIDAPVEALFDAITIREQAEALGTAT